MKTELYIVEEPRGDCLDDTGDGGFTVWETRVEAQDALDSRTDGPEDFQVIRFTRDNDLVAETLRDLRAWLSHAIQYGPVETRGHSDQSGHPHTYAAILIPDWQVKQKLANVEEILAQGGRLPDAAGKDVLKSQE